MKEDIKRIISEFGGRSIVYILVSPIIVLLIRGIGINSNIQFIMFPIILILLFLLPVMKDLKISPLETSGKTENTMSVLDMIALAFISWSLWYFISAGLGVITNIGIYADIIKEQMDSSNEYISSISTLSKIIFTLMNVVTYDLIFRGVLLNSLRKYGDVFAVIISSLMYTLLGNELMFPFNLIISLLAGGIYVLTNDIKASILFSFLIQFNQTGLYESIIDLLGSQVYFHGILLIIGLIYLVSRKNVRSYISQLKSQYRKERNDNAGKYNVVFRTEAFIALCLINVLMVAIRVASKILY